MIVFEFGLAQTIAIILGVILVAVGLGQPLLRRFIENRRSAASAATENDGPDAQFQRPKAP